MTFEKLKNKLSGSPVLIIGKYTEASRSKAAGRYARYEWLGAGVWDTAERMDRADRVFRKRLGAAAFVTLLLYAASLVFSGSGRPSMEDILQRPPAGSEPDDAALVLELSAGQTSASGTLNIKIVPEELSKEQAEALFAQCRDALEGIIVPEGSDAEHIRSDLILPQEWQGIGLSWYGISPCLSDSGQVDMIEAAQGEDLELMCLMSLGEFSSTYSYVFKADKQNADLRPSLVRRASELGEILAENSSGSSLSLPEEYRGASLSWSLPSEASSVWIICLGLFAALWLYFGRYDAGEKELKALCAQLSSELPSVSMQLVLLLNSGLVTEKALDELAAMNKDKGTVFFKAYGRLYELSKTSNRSLEQLFYAFARKSGDRDLIRFAAMIHDNASHGSELSEKLEKERQQLRGSRMDSAKARIKEAETALCFPLMLLMLSLIAVSAAPALLEMG